MAKQAAPRLLAFNMSLQLIAGLATIGAVVYGGQLAERLVRIPQDGSAGMLPLLIAFLAFSLVALGSSVIKSEYQMVLSESTQRRAVDLVLASSVRAELLKYESPDFHDRLVRALVSATSKPYQLVAALLGLVSSGVTVLGLGIALLTLSPLLMLIVAVGAVPLWVTARKATRRSYAFNVAQTERERRRSYFLSTLASRTSAGEIRVFGIGQELRQRILSLHADMIADLQKLVRYKAALGFLGVVIAVGLGGVVLYALANLFQSGAIGVDQAAIAAAAFLVLSQRLQTLNASAASVLECALFLEDIESFANAAAREPETAVDAEVIHDLQLENVTFRYPASEQPALKGIDLSFRRGELVALVGENGSGKTTLARILELLYPPTSGRVRVNGLLQTVQSSVANRRRISAVHQDHLQLMMTAGENIALGDLSGVRDLDRLDEAARFADIYDKVESLSGGFQTMLGTEFSGGQELSGGQWQRVAIARAWFRDADVLILDEPTSALDPKAEVELIERIRELARDKLVILISHRFGTVAQADRIVVLHDGQVVESGSHADLMDEEGVYASLYNVQAETFR
ncbi:MAG: ABC transporter ATP-binding protein [Pseudomonadales bacterium]